MTGAPQYRARPPDMSKTAPVFKALGSEHSHTTGAATSLGSPRRFSGLVDDHMQTAALIAVTR
jgi:hypothetical protein